MRVIISAGGTGGHIYPAISIINKIKEKDKNADILYIGTTDRMEKDIIPNLGIKYEGIKIKGLSKNPVALLKSINYTMKAIGKCKKIIRDFRPDIVIGVGGYVTFPVIYSAKKLGIKTLLHEQNSIPGKANKVLSKYADTVCISMKSSSRYFNHKNIVFTGNPRGEEILSGKKITKKDLGFDNNKKLVLITTGSLGSSSINEKMIDLLPKFEKKDYSVLLVTGKSSYPLYRKFNNFKNVKIVEYIDNMNEVLKVVDLIVSRAGATTIAEITAIGIPAILIPSPYVANNHQEINALDLSSNGACILIKEKDLTSLALENNIDMLFHDKKTYDDMKKNSKKMGATDSATRIYNEIIKLVK